VTPSSTHRSCSCGESDTDKHFDALLAGGDDFLAKPIRPRHLIQAVTNRVRRARQLDRRQTTNDPATDSATGLIERPMLLGRINQLLSKMDILDPDLPGGVIYVAIDQPYELRSQFGVSGFEQLSRELGPILSQQLSRDESVARYGDNAYCILIPDRSAASVKALAQDLKTLVGKHPFKIDQRDASIMVATGVGILSSRLADAGAAIAMAEHACRPIVTSSKAPISKKRPVKSDNQCEQSDQELVLLIEHAIENRQFQMLFQPVVSLHGNRTEQYQALIRLPAKKGPPIAAGRFLPVARDHGQLVKLDRWVASQALSIIDERGRKSRPIALFVNQSAATTETNENLPWLTKLIETRGVDPNFLILEFKLPEIVQCLKAAITYCTQLSKIGVQIALGGFDGSSSAFQVLEHFQAKYIKLPNIGSADGDKMFGMDLKSTIDRLHGQDKLVIIPAIEDARTAAKLWPTGVDFIQGNFVQKPESDLGYQF